MWVNSMLMTRDNPSIATKVNTMTSSVIILLLGNAQLRCLCHRSVRQEKIMDSGVAELMQRAYLSCLYRGLFSIPPFFFWSPPCLRDLFRTQVRWSQSHGFKNPCCFVCFFVDFPVSGVVRAKPQKVRLWCNVRLLDGIPPRPFPMNFLLEN